MILTAHQPAYLPWLGLFHKIALADVYIYMDDVKYSKSDYSNRNLIKDLQGGKRWLTVPLKTGGSDSISFDKLTIDNTQPWQRKHWNLIRLTYMKAPYFDKYATFFENVYLQTWRRLVDLNEYMLRWFLEVLDIRVDIRKSSDCNFSGSKSDLVLDMCKKLGANRYIFGENGTKYADVESFAQENVDLHFQKYNHPTYSQINGGFVSHLSIMDLLFNCGDKSRDILLSNNLVK